MMVGDQMMEEGLITMHLGYLVVIFKNIRTTLPTSLVANSVANQLIVHSSFIPISHQIEPVLCLLNLEKVTFSFLFFSFFHKSKNLLFNFIFR